MAALLKPSGSWATVSSMARARSTATDGDSCFKGMPNRYGSKSMHVQQSELLFYVLNTALDRFTKLTYDPPVLRSRVQHLEHTRPDPSRLRSPQHDAKHAGTPGNCRFDESCR